MVQFGRTVPVLRSFDEARARDFYIDFLGFEIAFEHRFGDNFPLYLGLRRGNCCVHLSEHHGDACPGAQLRIEVDDVATLIRELSGKDYKFAKPGTEEPEPTPWGTIEATITDPFGNRLTFVQQT